MIFLEKGVIPFLSSETEFPERKFYQMKILSCALYFRKTFIHRIVLKIRKMNQNSQVKNRTSTSALFVSQSPLLNHTSYHVYKTLKRNISEKIDRKHHGIQEAYHISGYS